MKTAFLVLVFIGALTCSCQSFDGPDMAMPNETLLKQLEEIHKKLIPEDSERLEEQPGLSLSPFQVAQSIRKLILAVDDNDINRDLVIDPGEIARQDIRVLLAAAGAYRSSIELYFWEDIPELEERIERFGQILRPREHSPEVDGMPALIVGTARTPFPKIPIFKGSTIPYRYHSPPAKQEDQAEPSGKIPYRFEEHSP
ncbi:MAG: hypothetical protein QGH40_17375 [bacterium]|nr:hypothetical protein [bacterium]